MNTTDFIATFALVISVVSITYTIVVDRRRPRLKVYGNVIHVFERSPTRVNQQGPYFSINATNFGPGRVCVQGVGLMHRSGLKRWYRRVIKKKDVRAVVVDTLPESPHQLPKWLEVGESVTLFYPTDSDMLNEQELFDCFYIYDSLQGNHWPPKGVFDAARTSLAELNSSDMEVSA